MFPVKQNGKPVKNGTAVLKVNGKEYTAEVKDGKATFKDVELPDESTEATIEYLGNEYYNPSNTTIKITIYILLSRKTIICRSKHMPSRC